MDVESADKNIFGWGEDAIKASKLMLRHFNKQGNPTALRDLQGKSTTNTTSSSSSCGSDSIELDLMELPQEQWFSSTREKFKHMKTEEVYYVSSEQGTETSSEVLSVQDSSNFSSIEENDEEESRLDLPMNLFTSKTGKPGIKFNGGMDTEEADSAMKLVGCHTCLMYFMVSYEGLKCPKCKGSSLLDFLDKD